MKKYRYYPNEPVNSLVELLTRAKGLYGDAPAIRFKVRKQIHEKTYNELYQDVVNTAGYLLEQNLARGHIALLGQASYAWVTAYLGTAFAGMVVIPLDRELPSEELYKLLQQSEADLLLYDGSYSDVAESLQTEHGYTSKALSLDILADLKPTSVDVPPVDEDKLFAILFTSGTTGRAKGVMLSQRNIARNTTQGLSVADFRHGRDVMLSALPLNHAYGMTCTVLAMIYKGVPTCLSSGLKYIKRDLEEFRPTIMFVVPLMAEKLMENVELAVKKKGIEKKLRIGMVISRAALKCKIDLTDKLFGEVKAAFGGRLRVLVCGGAPLNEDLINKYRAFGIALFQGYGLTECLPMLSVNFDHYHKPGSVGRIVEGNEAEVVDGEIWANGVSISSGYYNDPVETQKSFEKGWFRTGDLGRIDGDGFIFPTGRKKNLIILKNGENVSAEELEAYVSQIPAVAEVVAYGKDDHITAEIYLDPEIPASEADIRAEITKINRRLPAYKQITKILFRPDPFPKTTSKKIIRYNIGGQL